MRQSRRSTQPPGGGQIDAAPHLFESELASALDLLGKAAPRTRVWTEIEGRAVRKVRMPRTGYSLYCTVEGDLITVHAVWHRARGGEPPLAGTR
jgi:hypothetical protein